MKKLIYPIYQYLYLIILLFIVMLTIRSYGKEGTEWSAGILTLLVYTVINCGIGIFVKEWKRYIGFSIATFILLYISTVSLGTIISKVKIENSEFRAAYRGIILIYFAVCLLSGLLNLILKKIRK